MKTLEELFGGFAEVWSARPGEWVVCYLFALLAAIALPPMAAARLAVATAGKIRAWRQAKKDGAAS